MHNINNKQNISTLQIFFTVFVLISSQEAKILRKGKLEHLSKWPNGKVKKMLDAIQKHVVCN